MLLSISLYFPYTTLFRSENAERPGQVGCGCFGGDQGGGGGDCPGACALNAAEDRQLQRRLRQPHQADRDRSEEHTSELQSLTNLVCRLMLETKNNNNKST